MEECVFVLLGVRHLQFRISLAHSYVWDKMRFDIYLVLKQMAFIM